MTNYISIDKTGVHVLDASLRDSLERKNLSPTTVNNLVDGCHAKMVGDMAISRFMELPPDNAMSRGTLFHYVMEKFFELPSGERTVGSMRSIVDEVLREDKYRFWQDYPEGIEWLKKTAINGYYSLLHNKDGATDSHEIENDPNQVTVAQIVDPKTGKNVVGLEYWVNGKLGDTKRNIVGSIDRVIESGETDIEGKPILRVQDWKTGRTLKKWSGRKNDNQGLDNKRQQFIYGMMLEQLGYEVDKVQLIFPASQQNSSTKKQKLPDAPRPGVVSFDYDDDEFKSQVIDDVELADKYLDDILESNTAEFSPSILCGWCPLVKICPSSTLAQYGQIRSFIESYNEQPSPQELQEGIVVN